MSSTSAPPTYIYKIVPYPTPTPESLPTMLSVLSTLNAFFSEEQKLHLLRIPYEKVKQVVKRGIISAGTNRPSLNAIPDGTLADVKRWAPFRCDMATRDSIPHSRIIIYRDGEVLDSDGVEEDEWHGMGGKAQVTTRRK
ncbi:hypothetical protein FRB97_003252 [Tulasnella sp. 331]|nr:hypothetical protein FRB97_003252 [Tulasnella sp. 331]